MGVRKVFGYIIFEVLVISLIVFILLAGFILVQSKLSIQIKNNYYQSIAITQLDSLLAMLSVENNSIGRHSEFLIWQNQLGHVLPDASGSYTCFNRRCNAIVFWHFFGLHQIESNI